MHQESTDSYNEASMEWKNPYIVSVHRDSREQASSSFYEKGKKVE